MLQVKKIKVVTLGLVPPKVLRASFALFRSSPLREAKQQWDLLEDCFNHVGASAGLEDATRT